jgi:ribulose-phosphate 3-epimerase
MTNTHITLSASILSAADFGYLAAQLQQAEEAGVDWIHIDVMDGHFVPNITMGPFIVEACRKYTQLPLDVHLMISNPERHIDAFAKAGANLLSIHIENNPNVYRTLQQIRSLGATPGIVLNPGSPAVSVQSVLPLVDLVLVMTVNPGFSGQSFIDMTTKIGEVQQMINSANSQAQIQVDGGITASTLPGCYTAGARIFVAATALFKYKDGIAAGVQALRNSAG